METLVIVFTANWLKLQGHQGLTAFHSFVDTHTHTHAHLVWHKNTHNSFLFQYWNEFSERTERKSQPGNAISQSLAHKHLQNHIHVPLHNAMRCMMMCVYDAMERRWLKYASISQPIPHTHRCNAMDTCSNADVRRDCQVQWQFHIEWRHVGTWRLYFNSFLKCLLSTV